MSNPFAMVSGVIKGNFVTLRPVQFNDDDYDKEYRRSNGEFIRPTMGVTTCPMCSGLIEQHIPSDADLTKPISVYCDSCEPYILIAPPPTYPFRDPISSETLTLFQVNPTALSNLDAMFSDDGVKSDEPIENSMVERRSGGLGQFIRKRHQWKKLTQKIDTELGRMLDTPGSGGDVFDIMGELMDNTPTQSEDFDQ